MCKIAPSPSNPARVFLRKIMEYTTITTSRSQRISVDEYESISGDLHEVWLNIAIPMASMSAILTKEQAKELAATLIAFAEAA